MRIVEPSFHIEDLLDGAEILRRIERAGRTAYKSEGKLPKQFITIGGSEGQTYVLIPDGGPDARRLAEVIVDSLRYRLHLPDLPAEELRP